jgi:hypothetical protein
VVIGNNMISQRNSSMTNIKRKLPAAILKKRNNFNALPLGFTAREALEVGKNEAYNKLLITVSEMKCISSPASQAPHHWESIIVNRPTAICLCGMKRSRS